MMLAEGGGKGGTEEEDSLGEEVACRLKSSFSKRYGTGSFRRASGWGEGNLRWNVDLRFFSTCGWTDGLVNCGRL